MPYPQWELAVPTPEMPYPQWELAVPTSGMPYPLLELAVPTPGMPYPLLELAVPTHGFGLRTERGLGSWCQLRPGKPGATGIEILRVGSRRLQRLFSACCCVRGLAVPE